MIYVGKDTYILDSGREIYANNGIVGIGPKDIETRDFHEGYDGIECTADYTEEERREIAIFMIKQWLDWAGPWTTTLSSSSALHTPR